MDSYGFLSLLPPLIAIILVFITKRVIISLFLGVFSGAIIILEGNPFTDIAYTLDTVVESITDSW